MAKLMMSVIVGAFAFMQSASLLANTLTVTSLVDEFPTANDVLDTSALTQGTFRWALANSSEGDTIIFADSIAGGTINMVGVADVTPQQDTSFVIAHALTIEGNGVTIDGGWDGVVGSATGTRIFLTAAGQGKTTIKNLNLVNGRGANWSQTAEKFFIGGAVNAGSPVRLENCQLVNNCTMDGIEYSYAYPDHRGGGAISAESDLELVSCFFGTNSIPNGTGSYGGAIRQMGGSLTAEDTVFACNYTKTYGGGVAYIGANVTDVSFRGCRFLDSSCAKSQDGGNIISDMSGGNMRFSDCIFRGLGCSEANQDISRGGAIRCTKNVALTAVNCEFTDCKSTLGGAVFVNDGGGNQPVLLINCTFWGGCAVSYGGAIEVFTPLYLVNCTVAGDYCSSDSGGGIYANQGIYLLNTVIAYNFCGSDPRSWDLADYQNPNTKLRSLCKGTSTATFGETYTLATSPDDTSATKLFAAYEAVSSMSGPLLPGDFSSRGTKTVPAFVCPKLSDADDTYPSRVVEISEDSVLNGDGYPVRVNADCSYVEYSDDGGSTWKEFFKRDGASTDNLTVITADQRGVPYADGEVPIGAATVASSSGDKVLPQGVIVK